MIANGPSPLAACADTLLALARESIRHGLEFRRPLAVEPARYPDALAARGACFVSLHLGEALRGCIGQTEHGRPLVENLAHNAYAAAFRDPRFPPLTSAEFDALSIEVHVLTPLEPLPFTGLEQLYAALRPGVDGLQLETADRRGLFLPVMWEPMPSPRTFVAHLLQKARIAPDEAFTASRFAATVFSEPGARRR